MSVQMSVSVDRKNDIIFKFFAEPNTEDFLNTIDDDVELREIGGGGNWGGWAGQNRKVHGNCTRR